MEQEKSNGFRPNFMYIYTSLTSVIFDKIGPKLVCSIRFLMAVLCFFLNAIHFMQRVNISVGIVCMVKHNKTQLDEHQSVSNLSSTFSYPSSIYSPGPSASLINTLNEKFFLRRTFDWSKQVQGAILGSIFVGSFFSQIAAGWLSLKVGPKIVLLVSVLIASALTCLTPFAAYHSVDAIIVSRFLIGVCQGCVTSSLNVVWASWAPPFERSTLLAVSNSGSLIGNGLAFMFGGMLCMSDDFGGWPSIFFSTGLLGIVWCILWAYLATDTPHNQRYISSDEREYIIEKTMEHSYRKDEHKNAPIPWKEMLTSKVILGLIVTNLCSNFGVSLFITCLPTYINDVLEFDVESNGELSSIPFFTCWLAVIFSGVASDKMIRSRNYKKILVRHLFNSIGFFIPILTTIGIVFVDSGTRAIAIGLLLINMTFSGFLYGGGYLVSFNDVGGPLSGLIYGVANTIAMIAGFLAPFLMGILTSEKNTTGWVLIFTITAVIYTIGAVVYLLTASAETLEWAKNKNITYEQAQQQQQPEESMDLMP